MKNKKELPASLKATINFGAILLCAGNVIMVFFENYFIYGILLCIVGGIIIFPALKQARKQEYKKITKEQKKKRFVILSVLSTITLVTSPFVLPQHDGFSLKISIIVNIVLIPLTIGFIYWIMFVKLKNQVETEEEPTQ